LRWLQPPSCASHRAAGSWQQAVAFANCPSAKYTFPSTVSKAKASPHRVTCFAACCHNPSPYPHSHPHPSFPHSHQTHQTLIPNSSTRLNHPILLSPLHSPRTTPAQCTTLTPSARPRLHLRLPPSSTQSPSAPPSPRPTRLHSSPRPPARPQPFLPQPAP
jgi:hypothetical protein